jgi:hypothetical protein
MENFLSNFANTNTEVKSSNANISVYPEFSGAIDITKGALTMTIHFYTRVYKMKYDNCISLDDWDINDTTDISFGGMPIDNISALKTMLISSGLTTVANGLDISNDDHKREICIQLEQHKMFKDIFGKKARMFPLLSKEEKTNLALKFVIDNYDKMTISSSDIHDFLIIDEEGNKVMPTLEQLTNQLNNEHI